MAKRPRAETTSKTDELVGELTQLVEQNDSQGKLPPIRSIMADYKVSQATVVAALSKLEAKGLITRRHGSGIFIESAGIDKPILVLLDPESFMNPSSFWETIYYELKRPYFEDPDRLDCRFTISTGRRSRQSPVEDQLSPDIWAKLESNGYSGILAVGLSIELMVRLNQFEIPAVGLGTPARHHIRMSMVEACQLGVMELASLGCKKVSLYHPVHVTTREIFVSTLQVHGIEEFTVELDDHQNEYDQPGGQNGTMLVGSDTIKQGFRSACLAFGDQSDPSHRPDGILSLDDLFTFGYIMGLTTLGRKAGRDVQIATHSNLESPVLWGWEKDLIQMQFSVSEAVQSLHVILKSLIYGKEPSGEWANAVTIRDENGTFRALSQRPKLIRPAVLTSA